MSSYGSVTSRRSERAGHFCQPLHLRWLVQPGLSHDPRPVARNASRARPLHGSRTYSLYTPAGIASARDSPVDSRGSPISAIDTRRSPCEGATSTLAGELRQPRQLFGDTEEPVQVCYSPALGLAGRVISAHLCGFIIAADRIMSRSDEIKQPGRPPRRSRLWVALRPEGEPGFLAGASS